MHADDSFMTIIADQAGKQATIQLILSCCHLLWHPLYILYILKHAIHDATLLHTTVVHATKLHRIWWEVSCCMLHETCCLELDQWSNQESCCTQQSCLRATATCLRCVWHALGCIGI